MRDHRKLRVFDLADELVHITYRMTAHFPRSEMFGLVAQMRRSAVSVAANIVEGCARETKKEYLRFLVISFSSVRELGYYINIAAELGYLTGHEAQSTDEAHRRTAAALAALIKSLRNL